MVADERHVVGLGSLAATILMLFAWPALLLVLGGDVRWLEGWLFAAWFVALFSTVIGWLRRKDPALLAERYRRSGGGQRGWDRVVVPALFLAFIAWLVTMPLDARRFHWTRGWPIAAQVVGGGLLAPSFLLFFRSFTDNTYLSPLVRIQPERKQHVVSSGVYGVVRHPMYLGAILMFAGVPMLLASAWGLAIGAGLSLLLAARIVGEERMLSNELEGYDAYRGKVRYRLLPGIW
jgi:protein-S-isoprenylcysteine O-methyltransferase Ste14